MLDLKIDQVKKFFFDRTVVINAIDKATAGNLSRAGRFIQMAARKLIRKAAQKKLSDLSDRERESYREAVEKWKQGGRVGPKPRRSSATSRPGEPPRSHTGLLRKFLFFAFDPATRSVVVGPARLNKATNAPRVLEYGGVAVVNGRSYTIAPRPFMEPAYQIEKPKLAAVWHDSIKTAA